MMIHKNMYKQIVVLDAGGHGGSTDSGASCQWIQKKNTSFSKNSFRLQKSYFDKIRYVIKVYYTRLSDTYPKPY